MSASQSIASGNLTAREGGFDLGGLGRFALSSLAYPIIGVTILLAVWWLGGWAIASNPDTESFADFAPAPALERLVELVGNGYVWEASGPSLERIGLGLLWAVLLGVPVGVAVGLNATVREVTHVPFQFLRMISPLAWMPVAVLAFATWDSAIVFLIAVAAVWPVLFSTAQGVRRIDPLCCPKHGASDRSHSSRAWWSMPL